MSRSKKYYIYAHIDPFSKQPFYIGKGTDDRAKEKRPENIDWNRKVQELDGKYEIEILENNLTEKEAHELEVLYIANIGRISRGTGPLVNTADGGESGLAVPISISDDWKIMIGDHHFDLLKDDRFLKGIKRIFESHESKREIALRKMDAKSRQAFGLKHSKKLRDISRKVSKYFNQLLGKEYYTLIDIMKFEIPDVSKAFNQFIKGKYASEDLYIALSVSKDSLEYELENPSEPEKENPPSVITFTNEFLELLNNMIKELLDDNYEITKNSEKPIGYNHC